MSISKLIIFLSIKIISKKNKKIKKNDGVFPLELLVHAMDDEKRVQEGATVAAQLGLGLSASHASLLPSFLPSSLLPSPPTLHQ